MTKRTAFHKCDICGFEKSKFLMSIGEQEECAHEWGERKLSTVRQNNVKVYVSTCAKCGEEQFSRGIGKSEAIGLCDRCGDWLPETKAWIIEYLGDEYV